MSEELEQEVEINPIEQFIDAIQAGNFNNSEKIFQDLIGDKMNSALEAEKIAVAQNVYNQLDDEDLDDEDLDDEDFDEEDLDELDLEDEEDFEDEEEEIVS